MEESLRTLILKEFPHDEIDIRTYSPGTLAFLGDAVYSLVIRTILVSKGNRQAEKLHNETTYYVRAEQQAAIGLAVYDPTRIITQRVPHWRNIFKQPHWRPCAVTCIYRTGLTGCWNCCGKASEERIARADLARERSTKKRQENTKRMNENRIEGRNAVIEAFRSGRTIDRLYMLDGSKEGAMQTVRKEAAKHGTPVKYVTKQRLDQMSETGRHQGVIAEIAAYSYGEMEDLFEKAKERGEDPFFVLLDGIEDPHNLGAIIRTANLAGAHGVIIPKDRAVGLTATVAKASAGAINYTPVVKVTNLVRTMEKLADRGLWFVCADMDGETMTKLNLRGPIGLVIGAEGSGVSRLVKEKCDMIASIPMKGEIDSLNASVAMGVLAYEIVRQRGL